jgi:hypothetical protein
MFHQLAHLFRERIAERTAYHREIMRENVHEPTVDIPISGDDAVAQKLLALHPEMRAPVLHESADFGERAGIQKLFNPLACSQLALLMLGFNAFLAAAEERFRAHAL